MNRRIGERVFLERCGENELWRIDGRLQLVTSCVECGVPIQRVTTRKRYESQRHYCTRNCLNNSQRSGVAKKVKEETFVARYGVTNPYAAPEVRESIKKNWCVKYGVNNPSKCEEIRARKSIKMKELCASTDMRARTEHTCVERHGVKSVLATPRVREALREFALKRYGVEHHMKSVEFKSSFVERFRVKRGVDNPLQLDDVKSKVRQTCLERYGVDNVFKRPDVVAHRIERFIENARKASSKGEDRTYDVLLDKFGIGGVVRHVPVFYRENSFWLIDFYVECIDTYVQYDGVYWHAVGKSEEQLIEARDRGDKSARMQLKSLRRDTYQDKWFQVHGLRLFRIIEGVDQSCWLPSLVREE